MKNARLLGRATAGIGAVVVIVGMVAWVSAGEQQGPTATTPAPPTSNPPTSIVATSLSTTTTADTATTTTGATTTTTVASTTSTTTERGDVEAFADRFAAALVAGDVGFVMDRLHPAVVSGFGSQICEAWIVREIMTLSDYRLISVPEGPLDQLYAIPGGELAISNTWTGRVAFTFGGSEFEGEAGFAELDGTFYWLGQCR